MTERLPKNFGLVGFGNIGKRHANIIPQFGVLKAICDTNVDALKDRLPDVLYYHDIDEMLDTDPDLEIVVICTPNGLHAKHSIKALNRKLHVICEKPMALHYSDALAMKKAAQENDVQLFIVKQNRFNPAITILKTLMEKKSLGDIFSIQINCFWNRNATYYRNEWRGRKDLDGGVLFTQFSHFIDLLIWLFGTPDHMHSFSKNFNHTNQIEFEDSGVSIMSFNNGPIAGLHYSINAFEKSMEGSITIIGSKGTIKVGGEYLNNMDYLILEDKELQNEILKANAPKQQLKQDKLYNHAHFYQYVFDELRVGKQYLRNLEESIQTVRTIERIYEAN
jgi:UDP-N-acetyl-2-amino-2-deoxyglucuronate dehydrogenase